ncbi:hypothetical protein EDI_107900 [Entamoeba dispar SAW760]|uniref:Fungal lipase-type domain-containing protein n=1 Tax=Entamoeba dispar (strain ATCC PRA-260 / SAW760) TaxID=370354 RepID=B0EPL5_ENTDS|nr:uncharacterized protein EDI_107900 [Entamoeba dispar SAW760]EDR23531.1 hypothetical protein EDI_107900 [Entamoeba dispar SAW760]|eukprot:EDR23531.1 hypothetical protein EDI_107900 [Entamoeba dispar SAW760]
MGWYWVIFVLSFISGFIPSTRALSKKLDDNEDNNEDDNKDITITYSDTETESNEETDDTDKIIKQSFGFNFRFSIILWVIIAGLTIVLIIFIIWVLYIPSKSNTKNKTTTSFNEEDEYISFRARMNEIIEGKSYDDQFDELKYYQQILDPSNDVVEHSHLCESDSYGITPFDYSCLSSLTYAKNTLSLNSNKYKHITNYLCNKGWKSITINDNGLLHYLVGYNDILNVNVIGFRGTDSKSDGIYDLKLFAESSIPTMSVSVFPVFTKQVLSKISYILSLFGSKAFPSTAYDLVRIAKDVVLDETKKKPQQQFVLIGHSLGGGIANIVGNELGIVSFGISPPGTYLGSKGLNFKKKNSTLLTRAVIPERDPIAALGINGGLQMSIPCYEHSRDCHGINNSICMIGILCKHYEQEIIDMCSDKWNDWKFNYPNKNK